MTETAAPEEVVVDEARTALLEALVEELGDSLHNRSEVGLGVEQLHHTRAQRCSGCTGVFERQRHRESVDTHEAAGGPTE
mgnify:CR=1 FL=1